MANITTYANARDRILFLQDSYKGGDSYKNPSTALLGTALTTRSFIDKQGNVNTITDKAFKTYLVPHDGESKESFSARINCSSYLNICEPIVSAYVDACQSGIKRELGNLSEKLKEVTYSGDSYDEFIVECAKEFAIAGFGFAVVVTDEQAQIKYHFVDPTKVAYLAVSDFGELQEFVFINQSTIPNATKPNVQNVVMTRITSAGFSIHAGILDFDKEYSIDQLKQIGDTTPLPASLNGKLPVVSGYFQKDNGSLFPLGTSLIESQADIARTVYNLQSYAYDILSMHFPQLIYPIKTDSGTLTPENERAMGSRVALTYSSETNAPQYINPSAESSKELREHCDSLIKQAYEMAKMDKNSSSIPQSGIALRIKSRDFENAVKRFAKQMQKFETKLLEISAIMAGVGLNYSVSYGNQFTMLDVSENLQNALVVLNLSKDIEIGQKAKLEAVKYLLQNALPLDQEVMKEVIASLEQATNKPIQKQDQLVVDMNQDIPQE